LSKRERQIMDIVYRLGKATVADVEAGLPDTPGNSTVRKLLSILERKGLLRHEGERGGRYLFFPIVPVDEASESALDHVVSTFFQGSATRAAIAMLKRSEDDLSESEAEALLRLVKNAKEKGR
jgi:predicted transcriptional regulator